MSKNFQNRCLKSRLESSGTRDTQIRKKSRDVETRRDRNFSSSSHISYSMLIGSITTPKQTNFNTSNNIPTIVCTKNIALKLEMNIHKGPPWRESVIKPLFPSDRQKTALGGSAKSHSIQDCLPQEFSTSFLLSPQ